MDTSQNEPAVAQPAKRSWRRHSTEFKSRVIALARQCNASVAAVALANGLNANMLRRWVREAELVVGEPHALAPGAVANFPAFIPVAMPDGEQQTTSVAESRNSSASPVSLSCGVAVEIRRGDTTVNASLPLDERGAAWLRKVLG
jgi:transposase-like protein